MFKPRGAITALLTGLFVSACTTTTNDAVAQNTGTNAPTATSSAEIFKRSGIYVENALNGMNRMYVGRPHITAGYGYSAMPAPVTADFNGDGIQDLLFYGGQAPDEDWDNVNPDDVNTDCGSKGYCTTPYTLPSLFIGQSNGTYRLDRNMIVDNRRIAGHSVPTRSLVADFNGDGKLDLYIADTGMGNQLRGFRDSYYLSQPNGTLVESSATHGDPNFVIFDHGAATGDIDGDGDFDIVVTDIQTQRLHCLMNDGTGHLQRRSCGGVHAFSIELADIDGDGDLDLIHGFNEHDRGTGPFRTGVAFNDGRGNFRYRSIAIQHSAWGVISDVTAWDLDSDGDNDIVISRSREHFVGAAIEVLENLGGGKFNSKMYVLFDAPAGFNPNGQEQNTYNQFVESIRFRDIDRDGDMDMTLWSLNDMKRIPEGSILRNDGNMNFSYLQGAVPVISNGSLR